MVTNHEPRVTGHENAKEYQAIKKRVMLFSLFLTPVLLIFWAFSGISVLLREYIVMPMNPAGEIAIFFTIFSIFFFVIELQISYYSGFVIEHRFGLSNLTLGKWIQETLKRALLSFMFSLLLLEGLYFLIHLKPDSWWFWAWAAYAVVSWIMGKLFPIFIVPLFYKYQPLEEGELKTRILGLLARYGLPAANLFSINLSKTTKKANAAFMGLGKTKRVVLSDTLLENFLAPEIEQVVAHEIGHFKHRDIWKQLILGLLISIICFGAGFYAMNYFVPALGLHSAADVAGLPLLLLIFLGVHYLTMPLTNGFSRKCEYAADRFALEACRDKTVFISMMDKLGKVNLSDPDPAAWYEWVFHSHPSIKRRIQAAQLWGKY